MSQFVDVPNFFSSVYLVDFSPSLCEVAKKRFERLGWKNVRVVCQDARKFRLEDYETGMSKQVAPRSPSLSYLTQQRQDYGGADLVTFSYSLSMIVSLGHRKKSFTWLNLQLTFVVARLLLCRRLCELAAGSSWYSGRG